MKAAAGLTPAAITLCVNQLMIYDFHGPIPDVINALHPQHLIIDLELFAFKTVGFQSSRSLKIKEERLFTV